MVHVSHEFYLDFIGKAGEEHAMDSLVYRTNLPEFYPGPHLLFQCQQCFEECLDCMRAAERSAVSKDQLLRK